MSDQSHISTDVKSFYDLSADDIDGNNVDFKKYEGKVCIVVNVASKTSSHYKQLQSMYGKYQSRGLEVLAFPCNQFGFQESGSNSTIKKYVTDKFGVTFDMFSKISVNGADTHPVYKYLRTKNVQKNSSKLTWNFNKFVVDRMGAVHKFGGEAPSSLKPDIEKMLNQEIRNNL